MSRLKPSSQSPAECPICGCEVPVKSRACPECGADEKTGWNEEETRYDGIDLPNAAFDDEETDRSKPAQRALPRTGIPVFTWIVAVVLLVAIILLIFFTV